MGCFQKDLGAAEWHFWRILPPLHIPYLMKDVRCLSLGFLLSRWADERLLGRTRGRSRVVSARPGADTVLLGVMFSLSNLKDV